MRSAPSSRGAIETDPHHRDFGESGCEDSFFGAATAACALLNAVLPRDHRFRDANGDGYGDLILRYHDVAAIGIRPGVSQLCLSGEYGLDPFTSCDRVAAITGHMSGSDFYELRRARHSEE